MGWDWWVRVFLMLLIDNDKSSPFTDNFTQNLFIMYIWRSFSLKFKYHHTSIADMTFFPILHSFYLLVNEKLYWNFSKPHLDITKWTKLSIVNSLRVRVWGKLYFNSQKWGLLFHFNAACTLREDRKVTMKLFHYIQWFIILGNIALFW